jgi:endoglucanase
LLAILACIGAPGSAAASAPRLDIVGNHLVDGRTREAFVPRGANWPSFEYACSDGYGYSNSAGAKTVGPDAAGAATIVSWHINTVRVPLNQDCWLGEDGLPAFGRASGYRAAVRRWVSTLHKAGLAVILDLHWSGPAGVAANGQRAMADDRSDDFWGSVARAFRKDRAMIFDLFNEPYSRFGPNGPVFDLTWACWRNGGCNAPRANVLQGLDGTTFVTIGMQRMVDAIRASGAKQPIMVSGRDFGNDLTQWLDNRPADDRLIASLHNYNHQHCRKEACWDATIAPIAAKVPVVSGEFAEDDCKTVYDEKFMRWADRHGVGYMPWAWWILPQKGCSQPALLRNVRGDARKPNGTALKRHLARLAPRISLGPSSAQRLDAAVEVRVSCKKVCRAAATGDLVVSAGSGPRAAASGAFRLGAVASRKLRAGRAVTLSLKIPTKARLAAAAALGVGRPVAARITVVASGDSLESRRRRSVSLRGGVSLGS